MLNYDKENCFNQITNSKMDEEVVSLVEDEPNSTSHLNTVGSVSLEKGLKNPYKKKQFKKEEHYLKRVLLSRTSSPCPSLKTPSNLSRRSRSNRSKLGSKAAKHPLFKSPYAKPGYLAMKRNTSFSSIQSDLSSQPSLNDSFASIPRSLGKDLNTNQILKIKREERERNGDLPGLRKRVCRKVYSILNKEFKKSKILSKKLTLALEYRINLLFYYKNPGYIKTVKTLFKKLRVSLILFYCL